MKNNFKSRPILLVAALAGIMMVGCGPKSPSGTAVLERPAAETPVVEAPVVEAPVSETPTTETPVAETPAEEAPVAEGGSEGNNQPDVAETPDPAGQDVAVQPDAVQPDSEPGVGGPGEGVESIADKDAMLVPEQPNQPSVYWVDSVDNQVAFNPEAIAVSKNSPTDALTTAIETLLDGDSATAIPEGTELLSLKMDGKDVYIDLSGKFTEGGGTTSMATRMGQIIYTTTAVRQDANIWISVDGEQLEYIGGEGLYVDQPLTRERFAENFNL